MAKIIPLADARIVRGASGPAPHAAAPFAPTGALADMRRRALRDLRVSVTDRCNFRCVYCMPKDVYGHDYPFLPHAELQLLEAGHMTFWETPETWGPAVTRWLDAQGWGQAG